MWRFTGNKAIIGPRGSLDQSYIEMKGDELAMWGKTTRQNLQVPVFKVLKLIAL